MSSIAYGMIQHALSIGQSAHKDAFKLVSDLLGTRTNLALDSSDSKKALDFATTWLQSEEGRFRETQVPTAELAAANNSMGVAQASCGFYREAESYLMRSKSLRESLKGFKPAHNFSPLQALGTSAWLDGRPSEAERYLLQALEDREAQCGADDRDSARYVYHLLSSLDPLYHLRSRRSKLASNTCLAQGASIWL